MKFLHLAGREPSEPRLCISKQPIYVPSEKTLAATRKTIHALQSLRLIELTEPGRVRVESLTYSLVFAFAKSNKIDLKKNTLVQTSIRFIQCFYSLVLETEQSMSLGNLLIDRLNLVNAAALCNLFQYDPLSQNFAEISIKIYYILIIMSVSDYDYAEANKHLVSLNIAHQKTSNLKRKKGIDLMFNLMDIMQDNCDKSDLPLLNFDLLDKENVYIVFTWITSLIKQKNWRDADEIINRVEVVCRNQHMDKEITDLLMCKSKIMFELGDTKKALKFAEEAISIGHQAGVLAKYSLAEAYLYSGHIYIQLNNLDKARTYLNKGISIGNQTGYQHVVLTCKVYLGDILCKCNEFVEAKRYYADTLTFWRKFPARDFLADLLSRLAYTHRSLNELELAENYYSEAATLYRELGREKDCISMEEGIEWVKQQAEYARKI